MTIKNIDASILDAMPVCELATLQPGVLLDLQNEMREATARLKRRQAAFDDALEQRYGEQMRAKLLEAGKDSGIVHFTDGEFDVDADSKKDVKWDQAQLKELESEIRAAGDDPTLYMRTETTIKIYETAYKAWPDPVQKSFEPARTVRSGKPSYVLKRRKAEVA
jgi:hypothetical protein